MFKDESSYSVNPAGEWLAGCTAEALVVANSAPVLARMERYMAYLALTDAQRLWIRGQVISQLQGVETHQDALYARAFASLHQALATLGNGDELDARLDLSLRMTANAAQDARSCRWLQQQVAPAIQRSNMASLPMNRSWLAAASRLWQTLFGRGKVLTSRRILTGEV
ncbi:MULTISPECIES: hypothetical protein [Acidithiobacillus]|uniref:Uncharacterized protein n=1 Tax=Acidithiobacillus thiooxidans ATCC 19377 TaxID=637390 RepID=A0A5P9XNY2_ACITH|nr:MULTISPECIES: hypothetical protein [Acidithiobacillus]MBU2742430.1 hypothetical protein [Acidithiobacillus albertensis]MDA8176970.1 hypothetical protein [Acidithiobacillus sp.]QFX95685.1 hypothetical protein GCD22_01303 [Acidithiobacillus thiooxidans ATCC 19377]